MTESSAPVSLAERRRAKRDRAQRDELLQDLRALAEAVADTFHDPDQPWRGADGLVDQFQPPSTADGVGYELLASLREHLATFCRTARRQDARRAAGGDAA
jgi:hypothetical protein